MHGMGNQSEISFTNLYMDALILRLLSMEIYIPEGRAVENTASFEVPANQDFSAFKHVCESPEDPIKVLVVM